MTIETSKNINRCQWIKVTVRTAILVKYVYTNTSIDPGLVA